MAQIVSTPFPDERIVTIPACPSMDKLGVWEGASDYVTIAPSSELVPAVAFRVEDSALCKPGCPRYVPISRCSIYIVSYESWGKSAGPGPSVPPEWQWVGGSTWGNNAMIAHGAVETEAPKAWKETGLLTQLSGVLCNTMGLWIINAAVEGIVPATTVRFRFVGIVDRAPGTVPFQTTGTFS